MTANTVPEDPDASWRDAAACLEHPTEWFTGPQQPGDTQRAIDVCNTCPVKQPCLEAALQIEVSADIGIWGGTTPTTRRRVRRESAGHRPEVDVDSLTLARTDPVDSRAIPTDELRLFKDQHGDHVDGTGRVIVFEIHGEPPYMLLIDGKPRARTSSVRDAAHLAARLIKNHTRPMAAAGGPTQSRVVHQPRPTERTVSAVGSADPAEHVVDAGRGRR